MLDLHGVEHGNKEILNNKQTKNLTDDVLWDSMKRAKDHKCF